MNHEHARNGTPSPRTQDMSTKIRHETIDEMNNDLSTNENRNPFTVEGQS